MTGYSIAFNELYGPKPIEGNTKVNERIKELAEQSGSTHKQNLGVYQFYTDELEKFAELIVRECVKLCEHESNDDEYDQYDMGMSVKSEDIKASIMKTFGVK